jgi:hypothetical protein
VASTYEAAGTLRSGLRNYGMLPTYGFKVWKGNAGKDGVLRTQADIDSYWNYLTTNATTAGTTPSYLGLTTKSGIKPGMLAYQDTGSSLQTDGSSGTPNGKITDDGADYVKLNKSGFTYGFNTNLGLNWKSFSWSANIATSWGGFESIDLVSQSSSSNKMLWNREVFWKDMFDPTTNVNGKYPNLYYSSYNFYTSDYWQVSTFRCYVRSMSFSYTLPAKLVARAGVESVRLSIAGNNLWDFYNPYPNHYRNMYDSSTSDYPTLRTWSVGVNVAF